MASNKASAWMYPTGIVLLTLGGLSALAHTLKDEVLITYLVDPLIVIGIPLGWYWVQYASKSKRGMRQVQPMLPVEPRPARPTEQTELPALSDNPYGPPIRAQLVDLTPPALPANLREREVLVPIRRASYAGPLALVLVVLIGGFLLAGMVMFWANEQVPIAEPRPTSPVSRPGELTTPRYWSIGDTFAEVMAVEGRPEASTGDDKNGWVQWHYNLSDRVTFNKGIVAAWRNSTGRLKVTIGARDARPERRDGATFAYGSTMHDVLATLGMPDEASWRADRDEQTWTYRGVDWFTDRGGRGQILFNGGLVDCVMNWAQPKTKESQTAAIPVEAVGPREGRPVTNELGTVESGPDRHAPVVALAVGPKWSDYLGAVQGSVTTAATKNGEQFFEAEFLRSTLAFDGGKAVVFRRSKEPKSAPQFVGLAAIINARGQVLVGRCYGFAPEKGDLVVIEPPR